MRPGLILLAALATSLASVRAGADTIYKWVDASGVVHYSNAPPADTTRKPEVVAEDRISTYPSEPPEQRARAETEYLARRVERLERELYAQRQAAARDYYDEARAMQAAYEQCLADRRIDCGQTGGYAPYPYVVYGAPLVAVRRFPPGVRHFRPIHGAPMRHVGFHTVPRMEHRSNFR
jgi:uncharacterized protein DUF4124